jgi:hypothetical protein
MVNKANNCAKLDDVNCLNDLMLKEHDLTQGDYDLRTPLHVRYCLNDLHDLTQGDYDLRTPLHVREFYDMKNGLTQGDYDMRTPLHVRIIMI